MKTIETILLAILVTLLLIVPLSASADELDDWYADKRAECLGTNYSDLLEVQTLRVQQCILVAKISVMEARSEEDSSLAESLSSQVDELNAQIREIQGDLAAMQSTASTEQVPVPAQPMPGPVAQQRGTQGPRRVVYGGTSHRRVSTPSRVSVSELPGSGRLHLQRLSSGAKTWAEGYSEVRVVVINKGNPMPVSAEPGQPSGFVPVYADLDGDGHTDPIAYKGVNPRVVQSLWMNWKSSDDITVWYLVPLEGEYEEVLDPYSGLLVHHQVWVKHPRNGKGRAHYGGNDRGGSWDYDGTEGARVWD